MTDRAQQVADDWEKENPSPDPTPAPTQDSSTVTPPEPAAETTTPPPRYTLDDALPDDERIPPSMRGKPLRDLLDDRLRADKEAKAAGFEKNQYKEKADAFKTALEIMVAQRDQQRQAPAPAPKPSERVRQVGVEPFSDASYDAIPEMAREAIMPEVRQATESLGERVARLEREGAQQALRNTYLSARPQNVSPEDWDGDAPVISAFVVANNKNVFDPASYREAHDWLEQTRSRRAAKVSAVAQAAPSPPAPPVGNDKSAPVVRKSQARVSTHVKGAMNEVTEVLNSLGHKFTTDAILEDMAKESKYKDMFE